MALAARTIHSAECGALLTREAPVTRSRGMRRAEGRLLHQWTLASVSLRVSCLVVGVRCVSCLKVESTGERYATMSVFPVLSCPHILQHDLAANSISD